MSQLLINKYLTELAKLRQVGGTDRESVVREAFKDLLKAWGRTLDLTFTQGSDHPRKVQYLQIRRLQGHGDRLVAARDDSERGDAEDHRRHGATAALA